MQEKQKALNWQCDIKENIKEEVKLSDRRSKLLKITELKIKWRPCNLDTRLIFYNN